VSPPFEARIALVPARTVSGYAWTSGRGPPLALTSGTILRAAIAVREDSPLALILPELQRGFGLLP